MNTTRYVDWILSALCGFLLVYLLNSLSDKVQNKIVKIIFFILKALGAVAMAFSLIAMAAPFFWKYGYLLSGIYIALLADFFAQIVLFIVSLFKKDLAKKFTLIVSIVCMLAVFLYGTINSQIIRANELTYQSDKLKSEHHFVFLSDLHYGSSQRKDTVQNAFNEIKALKPDFVILGGDITDEKSEKEEMEWVYSQLGSFDCPVYFIYGNHDRQERGDYVGGKKYTVDELEDAIINNGLIMLVDDYVVVDDIVILGREDVSHPERQPLDKLKSIPSDSYLICVDHTPYQNDEIRELKADLQLSGHTHAGQYFPLHFLYSLAGLNVVDEYRFNDTTLLVSPGIAGWFYPFKNESTCRYEVITLKP